jgi:Restriction endonuclease
MIPHPEVSPASDPAPPLVYFERGDLRHRLLERLLALPFSAFVAVVADLLEATGYSEVRSAGRKDWRGHNGKDSAAACGFDLEAVQEAGGLRRRVLVQAKPFDPQSRVYRRSVDELRGACLREGAAEALLVTTGAFSTRLDAEALAAAPQLPVRLIGGAELLDLLIARRIGVFSEEADRAGEDARPGRKCRHRRRAGGRERTRQAPERLWFLDGGYFDRLHAEATGNGPGDCAGRRRGESVPPGLTVTVTLGPGGGPGKAIRLRPAVTAGGTPAGAPGREAHSRSANE